MPSEQTILDQATALVEAARRAGADAADAAFHSDAATSVTVRLGQLEDVESASGSELSLRVFIGQRSASVSTSNLDPDAVTALVERAVAMAREAPEDPYAGLAPEDRILRGPAPNLDLHDAAEPDPKDLRARALETEDVARAVNGVTNSEGASAGHSRSVVALATSHGFAGGFSATAHSLSATVIAGDGDDKQRDYAWHSTRHLNRLESPATVGAKAGERAVRRVGAGRAPSGTMPILFDPRIGSSLIGHLVGAMSGPAIARRTSFLLDRADEVLFPADIRIIDDPHVLQGLRSRPFDGEGLPTSQRALVADGRVTGWLIDSASGRQLNLPPTGHAARGGGVSTSNVWMEPGDLTPDALMQDIGTGIYVTELIGQGVNGVTGDYSRGASGFVIRDGQLAEPVAEFTIASNLLTMYAGMRAANDLERRTGFDVPTLRIDGMTVASG